MTNSTRDRVVELMMKSLILAELSPFIPEGIYRNKTHLHGVLGQMPSHAIVSTAITGSRPFPGAMSIERNAMRPSLFSLRCSASVMVAS